MEIEYSEHLLVKIKLRKLSQDLPMKVYKEATARFIDHTTGRFIAVATEKVHGKIRNIAVTYYSEGERIVLLTIHPLKKGQLENRIKSGRWREIK